MKTPWAKRCSESEQRRAAKIVYELEMECRRQSWGADPALVYDEEKDLFRFRDGRFAFSCEHADGDLSRNRGRATGM